MMLKPSTDHLRELLSLVAKRDRGAFASLYQLVSAKLFGIVLRILRQRELAEDILQDVFLTIWERAGAYDRSRGSPVTWMAVIARNRAIDEIRRRRMVRADASIDEFDVVDTNPLPQEHLELDEALVRLEKCLDGLEEPRRQLIRLAYLDGWSRDDLGKRFGHPTGTIKTWLHRSLRQLKECLDR